MFSKFSIIGILIGFLTLSFTNRSSENGLTDENIQYILKTLPEMVPQLREAGINVSPAYYIWPRDAALHEKGEKILEDFGYDALKLNALEVFCKAWFCLNFENLNARRQKIFTTTKEQITENPYITDDQKRINLRILDKELGHNKIELTKIVGECNLKMVRIYREKTKAVWQELKQ